MTDHPQPVTEGHRQREFPHCDGWRLQRSRSPRSLDEETWHLAAQGSWESRLYS